MSKFVDVEPIIAGLKEMSSEATYDALEYERRSCYGLTADMLESAPAADVAPLRHGMWKQDEWDEIDGTGVYKCSVCGEEFVLTEGTPEENEYYFCPHCGARMDANAL